jgi:hypothetical protein
MNVRKKLRKKEKEILKSVYLVSCVAVGNRYLEILHDSSSVLHEEHGLIPRRLNEAFGLAIWNFEPLRFTERGGFVPFTGSRPGKQRKFSFPVPRLTVQLVFLCISLRPHSVV